MTDYRKSSFSGEDNCVEAGRRLDAVRNSKNPNVVLRVDGFPGLIEVLKTNEAFSSLTN